MDNKDALELEIARIQEAGDDRLLLFQLHSPWTRKHLKLSYHRLILLFHPDKHAEENLKERVRPFSVRIQEAYEFLSALPGWKPPLYPRPPESQPQSTSSTRASQSQQSRQQKAPPKRYRPGRPRNTGLHAGVFRGRQRTGFQSYAAFYAQTP